MSRYVNEEYVRNSILNIVEHRGRRGRGTHGRGGEGTG